MHPQVQCNAVFRNHSLCILRIPVTGARDIKNCIFTSSRPVGKEICASRPEGSRVEVDPSRSRRYFYTQSTTFFVLQFYYSKVTVISPSAFFLLRCLLSTFSGREFYQLTTDEILLIAFCFLANEKEIFDTAIGTWHKLASTER